MILHTVNKSPFGSDCFASCLRSVSNDDVILLLEDGVFCLLWEALPGNKLYALRDDVVARGLGGKVPESITLIEYSDFVQLTCEASAVQSWY